MADIYATAINVKNYLKNILFISTPMLLVSCQALPMIPFFAEEVEHDIEVIEQIEHMEKQNAPS